MLLDLPTPSGFVVMHAVEPGSVEYVRTRADEFEKRTATAKRWGTIGWFVAAGVISSASGLLAVGAGHETGAVVVFSIIPAFLIIFCGFAFLQRQETAARRKFGEAIAGHVCIATPFRSGVRPDSTDQEHWAAANLYKEAMDLEDRADEMEGSIPETEREAMHDHADALGEEAERLVLTEEALAR
jgi:hypothetical protein